MIIKMPPEWPFHNPSPDYLEETLQLGAERSPSSVNSPPVRPLRWQSICAATWHPHGRAEPEWTTRRVPPSAEC